MANLAAFHELFAGHGATRLVVSSHLSGTSDHELVRAASPCGVVTIVRLAADEAAIAGHVRERNLGSEARLAGDDLAYASPTRQAEVVQKSRSQQAMLGALAHEDALIELSGRSVDTVVAEVADLTTSADPH